MDGDDERVAGWIEPEVGQLKKMVDFKIARAKEDDDVSDYGFFMFCMVYRNYNKICNLIMITDGIKLGLDFRKEN